MRVFDFHAPQERVEPKLWTNTQSFANVNAGRYVRNAILDGKTYPAGEQCPAWLKTRDAIHPLVGMQDKTADIASDYGGAKASAALAVQILHPWNIVTWWTPGGNGVNSWIQVKLPEATLIGSYAVGSKAVNAPLSWKLQGSLDETTWTDVHVMENTGVWDSSYELKEITVPEESRGAYLYYRLYITASNATTMSLRNLRLFRPQSVCAKGQLLVDASALSPLIMSFADGFDTDGVTPIDHFKSITAASLLNMFDGDGYPAVRHAAITDNIPININAVLDPATGSVSIETEDAGGADIICAQGGMAAERDKGWAALPRSGSVGALPFFGWGINQSSSKFEVGAGSTHTRYFYPDNKTAAPHIFLSKIDYRIYVYSFKLGVIDIDGNPLIVASHGGGPILATLTAKIGRFVNGIYIYMSGSSVSYSSMLYGMSCISPAQPMYKMNNGKLYTRANSESPWDICHKIKLGTVVLSTTGEVLQPLPMSAIESQINYIGSMGV